MRPRGRSPGRWGGRRPNSGLAGFASGRTPAVPKTRRKLSAFARVGDEAKAAAQREFLLKTLDAHKWSLSVACEALGLATSADVIRALKQLAPKEYAAAKADGRIRVGVHATAEQQTGGTLADIGRAAQRAALLAALEKHRWNLAATAEAVGVTSSSNVLRSIKLLGLDAEYAAAKASGKIRPGPHRDPE